MDHPVAFPQIWEATTHRPSERLQAPPGWSSSSSLQIADVLMGRNSSGPPGGAAQPPSLHCFHPGPLPGVAQDLPRKRAPGGENARGPLRKALILLPSQPSLFWGGSASGRDELLAGHGTPRTAGCGVQRGRWGGGRPRCAAALASRWLPAQTCSCWARWHSFSCRVSWVGKVGQSSSFSVGSWRGCKRTGPLEAGGQNAPGAIMKAPPRSSFTVGLQAQVPSLAQGSAPFPPSPQGGLEKAHLPDPDAASGDLGGRKGDISRGACSTHWAAEPIGEGSGGCHPSPQIRDWGPALEQRLHGRWKRFCSPPTGCAAPAWPSPSPTRLTWGGGMELGFRLDWEAKGT